MRHPDNFVLDYLCFLVHTLVSPGYRQLQVHTLVSPCYRQLQVHTLVSPWLQVHTLVSLPDWDNRDNRKTNGFSIIDSQKQTRIPKKRDVQ